MRPLNKERDIGDLGDLDLRESVFAILQGELNRRAGNCRLEDLSKMSEKELLHLRRIGPRTVDHIKKVLIIAGLSLNE